MVQRISIDVGQARSVAGKFRELSSQSSDIFRQLDGSINNIQSYWEGASSKRLVADFEAWKQKMQSFISQLADIGAEIDRVTTALEEADKKLTNR
jgi:WXG100 family type VII secretion target